MKKYIALLVCLVAVAAVVAQQFKYPQVPINPITGKPISGRWIGLPGKQTFIPGPSNPTGDVLRPVVRPAVGAPLGPWWSSKKRLFTSSQRTLVEITPVTACPQVSGGIISATPSEGMMIGSCCNPIFKLKVITAPASGTNSLIVYFESSADDGQTWSKFACVSVTSGTGVWYVPVSEVANGANIAVAYPTSDDNFDHGEMGPNVSFQNPIGNRIRIRYNSVVATSGTWTFQAFVIP